MNRYLIYGHKGWIGGQFVKLLLENNTSTIILGNTRVDNTINLKKEIDLYSPTHIMCFIGRTHGSDINSIDYLEQDGKLRENLKDNLFSPVSLAIICNSKNIHLTYIGTGCIFDGYSKNYTEQDKPNFFGSSYSTVKGYADQLMDLIDSNVLNLRIRMPIVGYDCPRNFITKIKSYEYVCSKLNSMTVLPDILPIVFKMTQDKQTGTFNMTNPGAIDHNTILSLYRKYVDKSFTWKNFSLKEQNSVLKSERSNNVLSTKKLRSLYNIPSIYDSIENLMKNYTPYENKYLNNIFDYKNTSILVTGGAGFIGSNFINNFFKHTQNIHIINYDALKYSGNVNHINKDVTCSKRYTFINGDISDLALLKALFNQYNITYIIHFAAQTHVTTSFTDSLNYTQDNIVGTHTLLEATRLYCPNIKKIIHVSTDEVYGESNFDILEQHKTESSVICPNNPYAATKAAAELICQSYIKSFNLPIIITRGNNVYGKNQYPEKIIPKFIKLIKQNKCMTIEGDGSCLRSFLHVDDASDAFFKIIQKGKIGEVYNIGCDENMEYSVLEIARKIYNIAKSNNLIHKEKVFEDYIEYVKDREFNDKRYYISNEKLKNMGWRITKHIDNELEKLILT